MSMIGNFQLATGQAAYGKATAAGSPAAIDVVLGFKPVHVKVITVDVANSITTELIGGKTDGLDEGIQYKENTGYKAAILAADGITINDKGFTIGTACQTANKPLVWMALG